MWTVGHGEKETVDLVALLGEAGVELLVDVRRYPASRRHPNFNRAALETELGDHGVRYEWWGESLGGRRTPFPTGSRHPAWRVPAFQGYADHMDGAAFRSSFSQLLSTSATVPTAIMCAETLWWRCHRQLLSDAAVLAGTPVVHLMSPGHSEGHRLHPGVRVGDDGWPVYDVGVQPPLL
jgi:uncharacterized protein (DUF488 family)